MSLPQFSNYIQIDESEQEELLQQTPLITNQKLSEKHIQKRKQRVEKEGTTLTNKILYYFKHTKYLKLFVKTEGESSTEPLQKRGKKGGSEERSWIWNYYEKLVAKSPYVRTVKCQVEIYGKNGLQPCGKIMNSKDYSTSNYIVHLNTAHGITKEMHDRKMKEQQVTQQPQIDTMFRKIISDNPQRKARLDQKFIGILVKDH